jgi:hypothetical protein
LHNYSARGWAFYAPGAILTEVLFILCKKLQDGSLSEAEHQKAVKVFDRYMQGIRPSPQGTAVFISQTLSTSRLPKSWQRAARLNFSPLISVW